MADDETALVDNQNRKTFVKKNVHFSGGDDIDCDSEPMHIRVTIYSMQGICRRNLTTGKKLHQNQHLKSVGNASKKSSFTAPTTALISMRGETVHTLVPSIPLQFQEQRKEEKSVRGSAFWQNDAVPEEAASKDQLPLSTFELSRIMKRQCFQPHGRIGHVSHYLPERVDFVVGVGQGKEMLPLGIALIAVSGEEEVENITNIPIKAIYDKIDKRKGKTYHKKGFFLDNESNCYSLDTNAILRVGIRVIPKHNYIPKTMGNSENAPKEQETSEGNKFIELNDENSLIAEFKEAQINEEMIRKELATKPQDPPKFEFLFCSLPFCGDMEMVHSPRLASTTRGANKISEARVLSLRAMSDVSGSTLRWLSRHPSPKEEI
jgi:hypothetical protein